MPRYTLAKLRELDAATPPGMALYVTYRRPNAPTNYIETGRFLTAFVSITRAECCNVREFSNAVFCRDIIRHEYVNYRPKIGLNPASIWST